MDNTQNNTAYFTTTEKLYNLSMLEEMDDKEYMKKMLGIFLSETKKDLENMKGALKGAQTDTICKMAHKIRSSAGIIQAHALTTLLTDIETLGKKEVVSNELYMLVENTALVFNSIKTSLETDIKELK